ncbi:MAG: hypothetical protein ABI823_21350 [Bryobacteraceae bacterium]
MRPTLLLLVCAALLAAQDRSAATVYRLNIELVEQADAQTSASQTIHRVYEMISEANSAAKINASVRVPYWSGPVDQPQLHTVALGSIVECTPRDAEHGVRVDCAIESSYLAPEGNRPGGQGLPPQMHSRQLRSAATIPFSERVLLSAFDDPASQHHVDIYVTARKVTP